MRYSCTPANESVTAGVGSGITGVGSGTDAVRTGSVVGVNVGSEEVVPPGVVVEAMIVPVVPVAVVAAAVSAVELVAVATVGVLLGALFPPPPPPPQPTATASVTTCRREARTSRRRCRWVAGVFIMHKGYLPPMKKS